jgi:hypothetical protein
MESGAPVVVQLGEAGVERNGLVETGEGLGGALEFDEGVAAIVQRDRLMRADFQRKSNKPHAFFPLASLEMNGAQQSQGVNMPGVGGKNGAVRRFRFIQLACLMQGNGPGHQRRDLVFLIHDDGLASMLRT